MSYADVKFLKSVNLRRSGSTNTSVEVDDIDFVFTPIKEEFNYVNLSREQSVLGYTLNIELQFRWITAEDPIQSYFQSNTLEIEIPDLSTGWIEVYADVAPVASYRRQVKSKEYNIVLKAKTPFFTLPAWSEPIKPSTFTKN